jgi:hypothetical protein
MDLSSVKERQGSAAADGQGSLPDARLHHEHQHLVLNFMAVDHMSARSREKQANIASFAALHASIILFGARSTTNAAHLAVSTHKGKCWLHPRSFFNIEIACRDDIQTNAGRRPGVWRCVVRPTPYGSGCCGNPEGVVWFMFYLYFFRAAFCTEMQRETNPHLRSSKQHTSTKKNACCGETTKDASSAPHTNYCRQQPVHCLSDPTISVNVHTR